MKTIKNCTVIIITDEDRRKQENEEWNRRSEHLSAEAIEWSQKEWLRKVNEDQNFPF